MLSDAILALFLKIFIQKLWPIFHNINNVCKFQNFHSPGEKKKIEKMGGGGGGNEKNGGKKMKNIFLQEKTYKRILHQKTD